MTIKNIIICILLTVLFLHVAPADAETMAPSGQRLRELAAEKNVYIGGATKRSFWSNRDQRIYEHVLSTEFNILTPENDMKWQTIHPEKDRFNWDATDPHVQFAKEHNMMVHGHTLVWHHQNPGWLTAGNWNRDEMIQILHTHIDSVLTHYKGDIMVWDVVNEAFNDNGSYRNNIWYKKIGKEYLKLAFQRARQVDPDAKLIYNDYSMETINAKSTAAYEMVQEFIAEGVPIDGIGFQFHIGLGWNGFSSFADNMQRFADLGMEIYVTELDITVPDGYNASHLERQAEKYGKLLRTCLEQPAFRAFQMWGFTDENTWRGTNRAPLIFDTDYEPKPAYYALQTELMDDTGVQPPSAPTTVVANANALGELTLSWVDNSSDELGFKIERQFDIGYLPVGSVGADVTRFTESGLENCSDYTYRVYAYNQAGNSDMSEPVSASTLEGEPPAVPSDLTAEAQSSAGVLLSWQDNSGNETGFMIEQAKENGFMPVARAAADSTHFRVSGLKAGETYRFRVKSYNNCFESEASEPTLVTMPTNGGFVERYVVASRDDAEENGDGSMDLDSGDLDIGRRTGGMRYQSVALPADATILRAFVEFEAKAFDDMETHFTMQGEYTGDAATFSSRSRNITNRSFTSTEVSWQVPAWNENSTSTDFRSPDLSAIVKEIISHPDWQPGNDMVFVVKGTGNRSAKTFDYSGNAAESPRLYIEYEMGDTRVVQETDVPRTMEVFSNYPNPFNPSTTLVYSLDQHSKVTVAVFDASGRKVTQLIHKYQPAGDHEFTWRAAADGTPLPSGLYVARLQIENNDGLFRQSRKMLLLR